MSVPFHFEQVQTAGGVRAPGLFYSETLPKNPSLRARNRQQVIRVHDALCNRRDASVLDTDFAPGFIDHSPFMSGGLQGVREMLELLPDLHHEVVRVLADGDLVAIHGRYTGLGSTPLVGFDIYRFSGGRIVEHWAALAAEAAPNASGRTQLDGPTEPGRGDAEANRAFVVRHVVGTLFNANYSGFRFSTDGTRLLQHSPEMADGVDAAIDWHDALRTRGQASSSGPSAKPVWAASVMPASNSGASKTACSPKCGISSSPCPKTNTRFTRTGCSRPELGAPSRHTAGACAGMNEFRTRSEGTSHSRHSPSKPRRPAWRRPPWSTSLPSNPSFMKYEPASEPSSMKYEPAIKAVLH